jgi:HTH-type transcriptional regulator/antitoxin MqsA
MSWSGRLTGNVALRYTSLMTPDQIRQARKRLGLTQSKFAEVLGVHPVTVRKWEAGMLGMSATTEKLIRLLVSQRKERR